MASSNKQFLLENLDVEHLRELADRWRSPITDARLRGPGIAKQLARKRSVSTDDVLDAMTGEELEGVRQQLGLAVASSDEELRVQLRQALATSTWRQVRRANVRYPTFLEAVPARLLEVIDGDTIRVELEGKGTLVRLRGIDAPETSESDKAERELDRASMPRAEMVAIGDAATRRLRELLSGRAIYLHCQPTPGGPHKYLHHQQYRLLAFVSLDGADGIDVGERMLSEGYALVWPRGIKSRRYSHQKASAYLALCCQASCTRPGLWPRGLGQLCPPERAGSEPKTLQACMTTCFPGDPSRPTEDAEEDEATNEDAAAEG